MATVSKAAMGGSPWGFELGFQTGLDAEGLVPRPDENPIPNAEDWQHLYRANVSYRFDAGRGVKLSGGLINSYLGYESYLAIDNPNYTRGYILDLVPYFLLGVETTWDVGEAVDLGFYVVTGLNPLADTNDAPGYGLQLRWNLAPGLTFTQNLYAGPEQADTGVAYWRVLSDSILEWRRGRFLLAGAFDVNSERRATEGEPRHTAVAAALWARWELSQRWSVALRPELYRDPDGLSTGARQNLQAYTATLKYEYAPRDHRLVGTLEVRYDRSTGPEGGFWAGASNTLVEDQLLVLGALLWKFRGWP